MATMGSDILIVDDEADIRELVSGILSDEGHGTRTAADADGALAEIAKRRPSLVFLDIWLQGSKIDGLALLDTIKRDNRRAAGRDDLRPRQHRDRGLGDQARRLRLHREAVQVRPAGGGRRARARGLEAPPRDQGAARAERRGGGTDRPVAGDEPSPPAHREGGADQQPGDDLRPLRVRQGSGGARHPPAVAARVRAVRGAQRGDDHARADGGGAVRHRAEQRRRPARSARSRRPTAARSISTKSATCRARRRTRSCASSSTSASSASAAPPGSMSTCAIVSSTARDLEREIAEGTFREDLFHRLAVVPIRVPALAERREDIPETGPPFRRPDLASDRAAAAGDRRRRDGGAPGP